MNRSLPLLPLLAVIAAAQPPAAKPPETQAEKVDKIFERFNTTVSPGCALSVMKGGLMVYERGYGMADLDHDVPNRPDSVFHVASVSKQFTATAIILLALDGKLSLDDRIQKYIPELPDFGTPITIEHLIHHTSGLRDQWELLGLAGWRYSLDLITDNDVLELMSRQHELNFKPGEKHLYCNTGYTLLAQIVKRVSGKSFREFTTQRIFQPLGMKNTHFRDDHAEIIKHQALGYERAGNTFRLSVTNFDTVGATSLLTTVEDLALWDENFYEPKVGGRVLLERQLQRGKLNNGEQLDYASGLTLGKYRGLPIVDHGGADAGYRADLLRFPEQHFSVACLCNLAEANPGDLTRKVADVYLASDLKDPERPADKPVGKTVALSSEQLSRFVGGYWNQEDERGAKVTVEDGKLYAWATTNQRIELTPLAENHFRMVGPPVEVSFEGAKPIRMLVRPDGAAKPQVFEAAAEFKPTTAQLNEYAGRYRSEEIDPVYRIVVEDNQLVLKRLKSQPSKLNPGIADYFRGAAGSLHFVRDSNGKVSGFLLNTGRIRNFQFTKSAD